MKKPTNEKMKKVMVSNAIHKALKDESIRTGLKMYAVTEQIIRKGLQNENRK